MKTNAIAKIKEIILDNNYFDTLPGIKFREWNNINNISAVIAFSGRSKKRESYVLHTSCSDSDVVYVTHLMVDVYGNILVQTSQEDTDDFAMILHPGVERIEDFEEDILEEWIDLFTF